MVAYLYQVTQYDVEYLTEYQYPDIYHCIPADVMAQTILKKGLDTDMNPFTSVNAKNIEDDILAALVYATLPNNDNQLPCGVLGWGIMNASSPTLQSGACPYTNSTIGASRFINESRFRIWSYKYIPAGSNNNEGEAATAELAAIPWRMLSPFPFATACTHRSVVRCPCNPMCFSLSPVRVCFRTSLMLQRRLTP